jgi:DNA-binding CsgD family transcriptional regulator
MINGEGWRAPIGDPLTRRTLDVSTRSMRASVAVRPAESGVHRVPLERISFEAANSDSLGVVGGHPAPAKQGAALLGATLGALGIAAFICDGLARVRALTPVAASALEAGRMRLLNGRLSAPRHFDAAEMDAAIAAATSRDFASAEPTAQTIVNRDPREPASVQIVDVIALPRQPSLFSFEPRAIVVLRGAEQNRPELEPILVRAFGLTPAEAQVAARLAIGEPRETIAAERGASLQTVRSQIKSIFAKLNVTRERELVSLLAKITQR